MLRLDLIDPPWLDGGVFVVERAGWIEYKCDILMISIRIRDADSSVGWCTMDLRQIHDWFDDSICHLSYPSCSLRLTIVNYFASLYLAFLVIVHAWIRKEFGLSCIPGINQCAVDLAYFLGTCISQDLKAASRNRVNIRIMQIKKVSTSQTDKICCLQ